MYVPAHFALDERAALEVVASMGAADLVTSGADGLDATFLPLEYRPADPGTAGSGGLGRLVGHVARNNPQATPPADGRALVIVHAGDHYVSPAQMPSTREHAQVVPTWDYVTVHVFGTLTVHEDPAWLRTHLGHLTDIHEERWALPGEERWALSDAPADYIDRMIRALIGVELQIERVVGKAKLSQNKAPGDVRAEIDALEARGLSDLARLKREVSLPAAERRAATLEEVARRAR